MPAQSPIVFTVSMAGQKALAVGLSRFAEGLSDFRPFWNDYFLPNWYRTVDTHYATHGASTGTPWPELTEKYAAWKQKHWPGLPIGVLSGATRESLTYPNDENAVRKIDEQSLQVGTRVPYAMALQLGWKRRRKGGGTYGAPARPPLRVSQEFMLLAAKLLQEFGVKTARSSGVVA